MTNHRLTVYRDADGNVYLPDVPELNGPIFGPRMLAMIGWMKSVGHCSYSTIETWMEDVLQVPVSRGYLAKLCTGTISDSLKESYDELTDAIPRQQQLGSDETSHKDNGKKHWIWCITAAAFSVFHIAKTRSREVLEKLVAGTQSTQRILGSDHWNRLDIFFYVRDCCADSLLTKMIVLARTSQPPSRKFAVGPTVDA